MAQMDTMITDTVVVEVSTLPEGHTVSRLALPGSRRIRTPIGLEFGPLFSGTVAAAIGPDGVVLYSRGDDYLIQLLTPDGQTKGSLRGQVGRVAPTEADRNRRLDVLGRHPVPGLNNEAILALHRALPVSRFFPILGRVVPGDSSRLAVERLDLSPAAPWDVAPFDGPPRETVWDILHQGRGIIGRVRLPAGFRLLSFRGDHLSGVSFTASVARPVRYEFRFDRDRE